MKELFIIIRRQGRNYTLYGEEIYKELAKVARLEIPPLVIIAIGQ